MEQPAEVLDSAAAESPASESDDSPIQAADSEAPESDETETEGEQPEEYIEVERNGKKYSVPKSLEGEFLMQSDYTRKTQSVAEERKAVEAEREAAKAEREAVAAERTLNQSVLRLMAQGEHLAATYQQLEQVNLFELNQQDPVKAQEVLIQKQQIANALQQVHGQLNLQKQQQSESEQRNNAQLAEKAAKVLASEIKGWQPNNEIDAAITAYAVDSGLPAKDISNAVLRMPKLGVILDKARQFDALMKKQAAATAKPKPESQEKPVTRITASQGTATKDPSKMSYHEFVKYRKSQIAQRR